MPRTMDEVMSEIEAIAFSDSAGADKMRALKILKDAQGQSSWLPEPMTEEEALRRLARLIRGQGRKRVIQALQLAYPLTLESAKVTRDMAILTEDEQKQVLGIRSLKKLYRVFPEIKGPGFPKGYPQSGDMATKHTWLQDRATELFKRRRELAHQSDPLGE